MGTLGVVGVGTVEDYVQGRVERGGGNYPCGYVCRTKSNIGLLVLLLCVIHLQVMFTQSVNMIKLPFVQSSSFGFDAQDLHRLIGGSVRMSCIVHMLCLSGAQVFSSYSPNVFFEPVLESASCLPYIFKQAFFTFHLISSLTLRWLWVVLLVLKAIFMFLNNFVMCLVSGLLLGRGRSIHFAAVKHCFRILLNACDEFLPLVHFQPTKIISLHAAGLLRCTRGMEQPC